MLKLETTYFVMREFEGIGIGNAGDASFNREDAFEGFYEAMEDGVEARAFVLEFDHETNAFEAARDITDEFLADYADQDDLYLEDIPSGLHDLFADMGVPFSADHIRGIQADDYRASLKEAI